MTAGAGESDSGPTSAGGLDSDGFDSTAIDGKDEGCSCRGAAPESAPTWLLGLAGALLIRRRRG